MAETPANTPYKYTPSSAQSTRHILDSTLSQSTASNPSYPPNLSNSSKLSFRPQGSARKSSNYAEADARAQAAIVESSINTNTTPKNAGGNDVNKGEENAAGSEKISSSVGWKPTFGRKQSWNQQDMKRALQMSGVLNEGDEDLPGFSEGKK